MRGLAYDPFWERLPERLTASPFPHCVVDGFLSADTVKQINAEWPDKWRTKRDTTSRKKDTQQFYGRAEAISNAMLSDAACQRLSKLSGIPGLIADKSMAGGGLHCIERGGFLNIHVDFNELSGMYRRLNVLVYLNEDWQPEWGGDLELWSDGKAVKAVSPIAGRCVIFATSEASWHGHPKPLDCPVGRQRRSMAFYYYTKERPEWFSKRHSTVYR
jgi:Rps23 Pro-64 3,4-dihydroxylase Tpa1-like proline 4-hydroxylase